VKRIVILALMLSLTGCNLYQRTPPIFIPPVGYTPTPVTPNPDPSPTQASTLINSATPTAEFYPTPTLFIPPTETLVPTPNVEREAIVYHAQAGDTLDVVATHFGVGKDQIQSNVTLPETSFINPGTLLVIPQVLINTTSDAHLLPDSEFVYSRAVTDSDFPSDVVSFVEQAGGYLSIQREYEHSNLTNGGEIIKQIAQNNSINPFLLLALLEYQSNWVFGQPQNLVQLKYPLGHIDYDDDGLVNQLRWTVNQLSIGYYGWREGRLTEIIIRNSQNPSRSQPIQKCSVLQKTELSMNPSFPTTWSNPSSNCLSPGVLFGTIRGDPMEPGNGKVPGLQLILLLLDIKGGVHNHTPT
jgi:LysM repeat protein